MLHLPAGLMEDRSRLRRNCKPITILQQILDRLSAIHRQAILGTEIAHDVVILIAAQPGMMLGHGIGVENRGVERTISLSGARPIVNVGLSSVKLTGCPDSATNSSDMTAGGGWRRHGDRCRWFVGWLG